eukprot:TRINITY_DN496_c0_g1_i1.p1 TRINITY_DN496_c0_g1~~TRINITY_DN496_c0_g1_i1.p1  ORF type:complete len:164 (+),score=25.49 TRINITY_DN496_c0_g1_i1:262-753(+)
MQNVLLQMNLGLVSTGGGQIKRLQQYALKCYGCFKICKDMVQLFCPECGNATLVKVRFTVDENGKVTYHQVGKITTRGSKYPIPLPKGGRNNRDLILSPSQVPIGYYKKKHKETNIHDPDLPILDTNSRKHDPFAHVVVGYGKRNPNEPRKKFGKKNKSRAAW